MRVEPLPALLALVTLGLRTNLYKSITECPEGSKNENSVKQCGCWPTNITKTREVGGLFLQHDESIGNRFTMATLNQVENNSENKVISFNVWTDSHSEVLFIVRDLQIIL